MECINFHYCGWDGRLKTLNFVIHSQEHLENILEAGERVDGSSLFPFIEAGKSDLYVLPKYRTAFVNPFSEALTVDLLCSYFNREGEPFESSPEFILQKAHKAFQDALKAGREFDTPLADGISALVYSLAAKRSSEEQITVKVPDWGEA